MRVFFESFNAFPRDASSFGNLTRLYATAGKLRAPSNPLAGTHQFSPCCVRMIVSFRTGRLWCGLCDSTGRVCEAHRRRPWDEPNSCGCGAAGLPCIGCNKCESDELPDIAGI